MEAMKSEGLGLICRNYRIRQGEIDLILQDRSEVVFMEVRYRASERFGRPEETINVAKRIRLQRTAEHFLTTHRNLRDRPCRFDVFAVSGSKEKPVFDWLRNAF